MEDGSFPSEEVNSISRRLGGKSGVRGVVRVFVVGRWGLY